jgi:hypothetical protein
MKEQFESFDEKLNRMIDERVKQLEDRIIQRIEGIKDETVGIEKAMEITNLSKSTIYNMKCQGRIPCRKSGKKLQFSTLDLKKWNDAGRV